MANTILIAQDEKHIFDELLVAAELAARDKFTSKRNAIRVFCEESPTFREYAAQASTQGLIPLPDPPKRGKKGSKATRQQGKKARR